MNQNNEFNDPKGQGQPPPYTHSAQAPPPVMHNVSMAQPVMHNVTMAQPGVVYHGNVVPVGFPLVITSQMRGMGPKESRMTCVSCNEQIITRVEYRSSTKTHLFAGLLCLIGCWPCMCMPYCIDSCRNADHYCPNCSAFIGSYNY